MTCLFQFNTRPKIVPCPITFEETDVAFQSTPQKIQNLDTIIITPPSGPVTLVTVCSVFVAHMGDILITNPPTPPNQNLGIQLSGNKVPVFTKAINSTIYLHYELNHYSDHP